MSSLTFNVNGTPGAQGSKRHVGHGVMVESSKKVKPWRTDVKTAAEQALLAADQWDAGYDQPVHISIEFRFRRPQSHWGTGRNATTLKDNAPRFVTSRGCGDVDKLCRSTFDALTAAGVVHDDSMFVRVVATKVYCRPGEVPGASITVRSLVLDEQAVA